MENEKKNIADKCQEIGDIYALLQEMEQMPKLIGSPDELQNLEQEITEVTNRLAALILQKKLQESLDCDEQSEKESGLIRSWPGRMKSEGYETVRILTTGGSHIEVSVRYYRRSCDRRKGMRYKGVYAGLVLLGIYDRCTPGLGATVSGCSALLSSFGEVHQVLSEKGVILGVKVIRKLTYRFADRARLSQQAGHIPSGGEENLHGRRVVVSTDGGRVRLRENKPGPKTNKGRTRYNGAWREPKLLIIYVADARGKLEKSFSPFIDGCIKGPDALFRMLESYLASLCIRNADRVLFVADGARWIWNRIPGLLRTLGLKSGQVYELIDFYHANTWGKSPHCVRIGLPKNARHGLQSNAAFC